MTILRKIMLLVAGLSVSACAAVDVPSRNTPFETLPTGQLSTPAGYELRHGDDPVLVPSSATPVVAMTMVAEPEINVGQSPVTVTSVVVRVPQQLRVSEANRYLPRGDIVWREDPIGNRHAQVQTIVQNAMERGVGALSGPVEVALEIQLNRFHALTEKARFMTGGVHSINFSIIMKNPATGALLMPIRSVQADLDAFGGRRAIAAMARGQTQKVRITDHLAEVIRQELTNPEGYENANLGFYQLLNNI